MADAAAEIEALLASHAGQPMDYVAVFMFLNTVAGGHYQERFTESEVKAALQALLSAGAVELIPGASGSVYTLRRS